MTKSQKNVSALSFLHNNQKSENNLRSASGLTERELENVLISAFQLLSTDLLKALIIVRVAKSVSEIKKECGKWPNKGTAILAAGGVDCLVLHAFNARSKPVIIENLAGESATDDIKPEASLGATLV